MKIQFKHQQFQADAAQAVCDVFAGQGYAQGSYLIDTGTGDKKFSIDMVEFSTGWNNHPLIPELTEKVILENIQAIQRKQGIYPPSEKLEGKYNLTVEMETGVGKTYTYIKTMYELNKRYGWSKFIVVVPSVAIREGIYKSFQMTEDHFQEEYGQKIRYFIYDSGELDRVERFAQDNHINVMIINAQAFNARGKDARRIDMKLDAFKSRRPIDILAKTNPILIIDEPQSVEGAATKEKLKKFNPLFTLRYSATHKSDSLYNMVYRLDALEAYNKKLVKKIAVKAIDVIGTSATNAFLYLEAINLSTEKTPTASLSFEYKGAKATRVVRRIVEEGINLYEQSNFLEEYKNGYIISRIDGRDNSIIFLNGIKLVAGQMQGNVEEIQLRRIQIRETIESHLERERMLFYKGIKVLSLFFIDEVAKYRHYDGSTALNGEYADIFEEEYKQAVETFYKKFDEDEYLTFLLSTQAEKAHQGYFSVDKKSKHFVDSKVSDRKSKNSDDIDAYDLIMKNKERLLDRREPVRFIFSHSALREGWDNPNVFQICTLKQSGSDVRRRQEVGRGLRLAVNQDGERMDANTLSGNVHAINILTVIASESYQSFVANLQKELAEAVSTRPQKVEAKLFAGRIFTNIQGIEGKIDEDIATEIHECLVSNGYVKKGQLTEKYHADMRNAAIVLDDSIEHLRPVIVEILQSVLSGTLYSVENARDNNVELKIDANKFAMPEFNKLWKRINHKSAYVVDFDGEELINKAIEALNSKLRVRQVCFTVTSGSMKEIKSKEDLENGTAFKKQNIDYSAVHRAKANANVKYDLIGKLVAETSLTRSDVVKILKGIHHPVFAQFAHNPEDFILQAGLLINEQKATVIIEHIVYNKLEEAYDVNIFTDSPIKGILNKNTMKVEKHLYDHLRYDSEGEQKFALAMEGEKSKVAIYVKLPNGFYISTPVGKYNPDWAISFTEGTVKHIYFVAETKGSMETLQLRGIEEAKIQCAKKHFAAISNEEVVYDVVTGYDDLLQLVRGE